MTRISSIVAMAAVMLSLSTASYGGTITGSRTNSVGTITGSRAGTITGSATGTITGSTAGTDSGQTENLFDYVLLTELAALVLSLTR